MSSVFYLDWPEPDADTEKEERAFWDQFGWARLSDAADRNTDRIPDRFKVDFGCPKCGSAWGELSALGFVAPRVMTGSAMFSLLGTPFVRPDPVGIYDIRAARLVCLGGHAVDFDSFTRRTHVVVMPAWGSVMTLAAVSLVGAMAFLYSGKKL